ncbi:MAG: queuosine precursor transporter [Prevotellaceae bacterium]|jgi:uncharacterized integral membrane protein (TIGR00697 family)|nr:queuosine precursor transporter [Prevotellaceae bacterium]
MNKKFSPVFLFFALIFATCLIVANIVEQKLIRLGPFEATAGLLIFPLSYVVNDLIAEVWGYRAMRALIWYAFFMNFIAVAIFHIAIYVPGSANFAHQQAFALVLGNTLLITVASFVAFLVGSFLNAYVMSKMKIARRGHSFSLRAVVSTLAGEGADSVVFFSIAFGLYLPAKTLIILIVTQIAMKTIYEIIVLPLTVQVVKFVKKREQTDIFDDGISYNPFVNNN